MSDQRDSRPNNAQTVVGAVSSLMEKLVIALPPAFMMVVMLNIFSLAMIGWVFVHNTDARTDMLSKIIDSCLLQRNRTP